MKKSFSSLILAVVAMAVVGCNAGETPVSEVQTMKSPEPANAAAGAPNVPEGARGNIPSNAIPPPPGGSR